MMTDQDRAFSMGMINALGAADPFRDSAEQYVAAGWAPFPLPPKAKKHPPTGVTGHLGKGVKLSDVERWLTDPHPHNVGLRLPGDVIGIDVDEGYITDGEMKCGAQSLAELEDRYGPLPPTWSSTSRGTEHGPGLSRILLFRVPMGTRLRSAPGPAIESIQRHHRYMVCWPSEHPDGRMYTWYDDAGDTAQRIPEVDDLADLPWEWIEGLRSVGGDTAEVAAPEEVAQFLETHVEDRTPGRLKGIKTKLADRPVGTARHDYLLTMACWAMREAAAGYYTASDAIALLRQWWTIVMDSTERLESSEFDDAIAWAIAQAAHEPKRVARLRDDSRPPIDPEASLVNLPASFWAERPVLTQIRLAALSRLVSPDALLHVVLARVAAITSHTVELPPSVGGAMGLSYLATLIGPSGAGKSTSMSVGADLLAAPDDVLDRLPVGSGEGLVEVLFRMVEEEGPNGKMVKVKRQTNHQAIVFIDEGQALTELGGRQGSTLLSTLRTIYTHGTIGNTNASEERKRVVRGELFVYGIVVGLQPELAGPLLGDAAAGTPQRFSWAMATDPSMPDDLPEWPGALDWAAPTSFDLEPYRITGTYVRHRLELADPIRSEIRAHRLAVMRGQGDADPMLSHAHLSRLKVAALLALLDRRMSVSEDDWRLAGVIFDTSSAVRRSVQTQVANVAKRTEEARTAIVVQRQATIESDASTRALASAARSASRKIHLHHEAGDHDGGPCVQRCLSRAIASKHRQLVTVDEVVDRAIADGYIVRDGDGFKPGRVSP